MRFTKCSPILALCLHYMAVCYAQNVNVSDTLRTVAHDHGNGDQYTHQYKLDTYDPEVQDNDYDDNNKALAQFGHHNTISVDTDYSISIGYLVKLVYTWRNAPQPVCVLWAGEHDELCVSWLNESTTPETSFRAGSDKCWADCAVLGLACQAMVEHGKDFNLVVRYYCLVAQ